jgi:4-amino-4-deoxy-L-arabinose transferase-like glycosyltransferase
VRLESSSPAPTLPGTVLKLTVMYAAAAFMASLAAYAAAVHYGHPDRRPSEWALAAALFFGALWGYSLYRVAFPNNRWALPKKADA